MNEDNNNGNAAPEQEMFPLDEAAIEAITELDAQEKELIARSEKLAVARNAILSYFLRVHKLQGDWKLAENRRELAKLPAPAPAPVPQGS